MANLVFPLPPRGSRRGVLDLDAFRTAQAHHVIVFRPGGTAGGNVFTTWASVVAELAELDGPKVVYFDDDLAACEIPSGTWDVNGATFAGDRRSPLRRAVEILDGATLQNLDGVTDGLDMVSAADTTPITRSGGVSAAFRVGAGARIGCTGAAPAIHFAGGGYPYLGPRSIVAAPFVAAGAVSTSGLLYAMTEAAAAIGPNAFAGAGNVVVMATAAPDFLDETHANLTGAFARTGAIPISQASKMLDDANHFFALRPKLTGVDTAGGGPYTYELPAPSNVGYPDGYEEIVKDAGNNASVNAITISTAGGTIDGNATASITVNNGALRFRSNGTIWNIVGMVG